MGKLLFTYIYLFILPECNDELVPIIACFFIWWIQCLPENKIVIMLKPQTKPRKVIKALRDTSFLSRNETPEIFFSTIFQLLFPRIWFSSHSIFYIILHIYSFSTPGFIIRLLRSNRKFIKRVSTVHQFSIEFYSSFNQRMNLTPNWSLSTNCRYRHIADS